MEGVERERVEEVGEEEGTGGRGVVKKRREGRKGGKEGVK